MGTTGPTGCPLDWTYAGDITDETTIVGPTGAQGLQGLQGDIGLQGLQGDIGFQGPQGDIGLQGLQGDIGLQGLQGDIGFQGPQGDIGLQGLQGDIGLQGPQGDIGLQGLQGDIGLQGLQGDIGLQGPQGDIGLQGYQGDVGLQGYQGDIGIQGAQGDIGYQGLQGDIGPQGYQGLQGDKGDTGQGFVIFSTVNNFSELCSTNPTISNIGEFVLITGGELFVYAGTGMGTTGPTGCPLDWTYAGDITDETTIVGPTGAQGLQGPQGDIGLQGYQGDIGYQGLQGDIGLQGLQGDIGLQGYQGDIGYQGETGPMGATFMTLKVDNGTPSILNPITVSFPDGSIVSQDVSSYQSFGAQEGFIYQIVVPNISVGTLNTLTAYVENNSATSNASFVLRKDTSPPFNSVVDTYVNGVLQTSNTVIVQGDYLYIGYDGYNISFYKNGIQIGSIVPFARDDYFMHIRNTMNQTVLVNDIRFYPMGFKGDQGSTGAQGDIGPQGYQGDIGYQGDMGYQGDFGPQGYQGYWGATTFTWNLVNTAVLTSSNSLIKDPTFTDWDSSAYSSESYTYGAFMSFQPPSTSNYFIAGLSETVGTPSQSETSYGWFLDQFGNCYVIESGTIQASFTYSSYDTFQITYDGYDVNYIQNGTILYTTYRAVGLPLHLNVVLGDNGCQVVNVHFGPQGQRGSSTGASGGGVVYYSISTGTFSANPNTFYIWNLPSITGVLRSDVARVILPSNPTGGDVIKFIDGLGTWGNLMYTGGVQVDGNGIQIVGNLSTGVTGSNLFDVRLGEATFIYNSELNRWTTYANQNQVNPITTNLNPIQNQFNGWWLVINRSNMITPQSLFANNVMPLANNYTQSNLSYVYIDTTVYPIQISWYFGSSKNPSTFNTFTTNLHEFLGNDFTTLVNLGSSIGSFYNQSFIGNATGNNGLPYLVGNDPNGFKLQTDNNYCILSNRCCTGREGPASEFFPVTNTLLKKCITSPFTQKPDGSQTLKNYSEFELNQEPFDDPVYMARNMFEKLYLGISPNVNDQESTIENGETFVPNSVAETKDGGYMIAKDIFNNFLNGITFQTNVIAVRKSYSGASSHYFQGSTQLTDIYTGQCPYAYPGSNVTLSGFLNSWSGMNGIYTNGVSMLGESSLRKSMNEDLCDFREISPGNYTGSQLFNTNKFLLIKDTYSDPGALTWVAQETGAYKGFGINIGNGVCSITHRFYSSMKYNEFVSAWMALHQYINGPETHTYMSSLCIDLNYLSVGKVQTSWKGISTGYYGNFSSRGFGDAGYITNKYGEISSLIYQTGALTPALIFNSYPNDPYQVQYEAYKQFYQTPLIPRFNLYTGPFADDDMVSTQSTYIQENYMQTGSVRVLCMGWAGTGLTGPIEYSQQYAMTPFAYPLINTESTGTLGGSEFVGKVFDWSATPTGAGPTEYDPRYWCIQGQGNQFTSPLGTIYRKNTLYFGLIKPSMTYYSGASGPSGLKNVGYIKLPHTKCLVDRLQLQQQSIFAPKNLITPSSKEYREANSKVLSEMMKYLVTDLNCDSIIIDNRANMGGGNDGRALAEFFGDDRLALHVYDSDQGSGFNVLRNLNTGPFLTPENVGQQYALTQEQLYVSENETNYPGSVFRGSTGAAKKVIIISGLTSEDHGSTILHYFIGDNFNKMIGSNTSVQIIGQVDGRYTGYDPYMNCLDTQPSYTSKKVGRWPFMGFQIEGNNAGTYIAHIPASSTGPFFSLYNENADYLGPMSTDSGFKGLSGIGNSLPMSMEEMIYPDIGAYPNAFSEAQSKYPTRYLTSNPTIPTISDYHTWRDTLIEQAVINAISP